MKIGVYAVMRDGAELELDPKYGKTPESVVRVLTEASLTGSAVPLANAELDLLGGGTVRYADVNKFTVRPTL